MNRGSIQREHLIGVVPLATVAKVVFHTDEATFLQLLNCAACGTVRDAAGLGDGRSAGIAALCFVMAAQQVAIDGKSDWRQPICKDFSWQHDEWFLLHFLLLLFSLIKSSSTI